MENKDTCIGSTESVCPVCLQRIPAHKIKAGDEVYLEKECPDHGSFRTLIWRGAPDYETWGSAHDQAVPVNPAHAQVEKGCPYDCGLCPDHRQHTCCVLMEVTSRCNLRCPVCFASAGSPSKEPNLELIGSWFDAMMECGGPFNIQLSGGEPTMRDDLGQIIKTGRQKGFTFFQLNTNGIRIAEEPGYIEHLADAGLNCVFLQFDGLRDETYQRLRGRPLFEMKRQAIAKCAAAGIGVVLVPTLAAGVNTGETGNILQFALDHMPAVRGVHFQPISYFGRFEDMDAGMRYTLPDLLRDIEIQTEGRMKVSDFTPGNAENAYCSFSGNFMKMQDGTIRSLNTEKSCGCGAKRENPGEASKKAQKFVARRWSSGRLSIKSADKKENCCCQTGSLDEFLERIEQYTLAVSCMTFMDAWNLDLDRLKECYIHILSQKQKMNLVPFCAYNLTAAGGRTLYRGQEEIDT